MINRTNGVRLIVCALTACLFLLPEAARACAVCFGDPESAMAKGVVAGVWVLLGVVSFVLVGVAGISLFWVHRSRMLTRPIDPDTLHP